MKECLCVGKHVPLPHRLYKINTSAGVVWVCPTTYENILVLRDEYRKHHGRPPGSVRKHFSDFVQKIADAVK